MPLFCRSAEDVDPALEALRGGETYDSALARNFMCDHRVPPQRERHLRAFFGERLDRQTFEEAVKAYKDSRVRRTHTPDFIDDSLNGPNILSGKLLGEHDISRDYELGRVLRLNMPGVYRSAKSVFASVERGSDAHIDQWLTDQLKNGNVTSFIEVLLKELWRQQRDVEPFEPCWATSWSSLEAVADLGPERWAASVGTPVFEGQWLILLRYRVRETGTLVRPTQLDAGWDCRHFPSPPTTPLTLGGHPMDLGDRSCRPALVPEFIHQQIPHKIEHWEDAGSRIAQVRANTGDEFSYQRWRHFALLKNRDGNAVLDWMPEPL